MTDDQLAGHASSAGPPSGSVASVKPPGQASRQPASARSARYQIAVGPFRARHLAAIASAAIVTTLLVAGLTSPLGTPSGPGAPVPGASFYVVSEPASGLGIGEVPPALADEGGPLVDLAGQPLDLANLRGQPVWVLFWASWCPPCQQETPDIERAYRANESIGLRVVAVSIEEPADVVRAYASDFGLTYSIALDPSAGAFRRWGVFGLPTHYFIGRDGTIRDRWFGPLSLSDMQSRIDLIAGP